MHIDTLSTIGPLVIELFDENGNLKLRREEKNMLVTTGLAHIASRLLGAAQSIMSHMAVGTGNTAAATSQTALVTEAARVAFTSFTNTTTTVANDSVLAVATFGPGVGTGALVEAGIFNAGAAGTMLSRVVFGVITKGATDTMTISWTLANANGA